MDLSGFVDAMLASGKVLTVPWSIDYFSIVVGAITGALFACERKLDIVGTVVLGLITAYGGGLIRDVILQNQGVYFTEHPDLIVICILICVFVFYFRGLFKRLDRAVFFADALSVSLFALAGASKAFSAGSGIVVSIILGVITAVGGGAVRDVCVGETPSIFKRSNFYAVACLGGAAVYVVLAQVGCPLPIAGVLCVAAALGLRFGSVAFDLKTAQEADLAPAVMERVRSLRRGGRGGDCGKTDGSARGMAGSDRGEFVGVDCGKTGSAGCGRRDVADFGEAAGADRGKTAQNGAGDAPMTHNRHSEFEEPSKDEEPSRDKD